MPSDNLTRRIKYAVRDVRRWTDAKVWKAFIANIYLPVIPENLEHIATAAKGAATKAVKEKVRMAGRAHIYKTSKQLCFRSILLLTLAISPPPTRRATRHAMKRCSPFVAASTGRSATDAVG